MNRFSKGKTIGVIACSLAAVSLAGIGFSAWVITGNTSADVSSIKVTVADVNDSRISITNASVVSNEDSIRFDAKSSTTTGTLLSASNDASEKLSFKIKYTVNNSTSSNKFNIKAYIKTDNNQPNFKDATEHHLITMPEGINLDSNGNSSILTYSGSGSPTLPSSLPTGSATITAVTDSSGSYNVEQTFTFGWGLGFASKNPSEVTTSDQVCQYGSSAHTVDCSSNKQAATVDILKTNLNKLKEDLASSTGNVSFTLVLTPTLAS